MFSALRQAIVMLVARGQQRETDKDARRFLATVGGWFRKPAEIKKHLDSFAKVAEIHEAEVRSWVDPSVISAGGGGPFDACDLRVWLALAERAGVPFIEAREVLHLSDDEMSYLSGKVEIPDTASRRLVRKRLAEMPELLEGAESIQQPEPTIDHEALVERLYAALDDVPEGWMVRCHRAGSTELKSLAGSGAIGIEEPTAKFGQLEVGPGWIREGNRRRVHVSDNRTVQVIAQGPGDAYFLARPWARAARYAACEDPHRHGTVFAGKGLWPAEWRCFVLDGKVTSVSWYYPWSGEASAQNARVAIEVRGLAQRIVDQAVAQKAVPRLPEVEFARQMRADDPRIAEAVKPFSGDRVSCTLDFIEVEGEGLNLLEGGPGCTPFGGGHPCGFAGTYKPGELPPHGVAFKLMDGILLGDMETWKRGGDRTGCIMTWDSVDALAAA